MKASAKAIRGRTYRPKRKKGLIQSITNFNEDYPKLAFYIWVFFLIIGICSLVYSIDLYQKMLHNIDLTYNFVKDPAKTKYMYDEYSPGKMISLTELYILSLHQLWVLHFIIAWAAFTIGWSLGVIFPHLRFR